MGIPDRFDLKFAAFASGKLSPSKSLITVQCECNLEETLQLVPEKIKYTNTTRKKYSDNDNQHPFTVDSVSS